MQIFSVRKSILGSYTSFKFLEHFNFYHEDSVMILLFAFAFIVLADYVPYRADFSYSYENKPQFFSDFYFDDPDSSLLNDGNTTEFGLTKDNAVGIDPSNLIYLMVHPLTTTGGGPGTELSSVTTIILHSI